MPTNSSNEVLAWCPTRETFLATMRAVTLPDGRTLAVADEETGENLYIDGLHVDEIGPVIEPAGVVEGHHVNMLMVDPLTALVNTGRPADMSLAEWLVTSGLLGNMTWSEIEPGVPAGWVGASGMKIFAPTAPTTRYRVWC